MKTSVASLFSLISASFSRRNMRLVAEPTFVKIYEDWNESFDVSTILNFDVRKVFTSPSALLYTFSFSSSLTVALKRSSIVTS